jgi:hypothetical protein
MQEVKKEKRKVQKILRQLLAKTGEKKAQVYLISIAFSKASLKLGDE